MNFKGINEHKFYPLHRYATNKPNDDFYYITNVPPEVAEEWIGIGFDYDDQYNSAPTQGKLIGLAKKCNGKLSGFVIPIASGRDDSRIEFDGMILNIPKGVAVRWAEKLNPDEFHYVIGKGWSFWWD